MSFGCCGEISAGSEFIIHTHFCTIHGRFSRNILKDSSAEKFLDILPFHWVALGVNCSIWPLAHFGRASLVLMTMLDIINFQRGNHYVGIGIASHQRHICGHQIQGIEKEERVEKTGIYVIIHSYRVVKSRLLLFVVTANIVLACQN